MTPNIYIPIDRRHAMARGGTLPERTTGAALFADISGFTPLTTALLKELGLKRGPEELTHQLNIIYDALIDEVHRYGGTVIGFAGDAITCWFDKDDGRRSISCGLALQQAMEQFKSVKTAGGSIISLAIKVAVSIGAVRRFLVGIPDVSYKDVLAGSTIDRMAAGEGYAEKGDVIAAPEVVAQIGDMLEIAEFRMNEQGEKFAVVTGMTETASAMPWGDEPTLSEEQLTPWVLRPIYERMTHGQEQFVAEIRPATALFMKFSGIDYDNDAKAREKLDTYIQWVQSLVHRYEGTLIQLTLGDKGSFIYTAFGAPIAHEDDSIRALSMALDLLSPPAEIDFIDPVQIGISQGRMRAGPYGGSARVTYGVLGDEVNMSARLMGKAKPGQVLVSEFSHQSSRHVFDWDVPVSMLVKGKVEPITVYRLLGKVEQSQYQLQGMQYTMPMVGRQAELTLIEEKIEHVLAGKGQIIGITAEAGMGKSRLATEVIHVALKKGLVGYGGACQSYGTQTSYLMWESVWRAFFNIAPKKSIAEQTDDIRQQLEQINPAFVSRLPLLGAMLNLPLLDNDVTANMETKLRKSSLESLLIDCLRTWAGNYPLLIMLEDVHWIDALSRDLLEGLARSVEGLPVLFLVVYRPPELQKIKPPQIDNLSYFTEIKLDHFTTEEAATLIRIKLEQFSDTKDDISTEFVERITARAQGNPFYIDELLNYLHDQHIDPHDTESIAQLDLPTSLHSLILSRVDQLTETQKLTLKIASVIGRIFETALLWGIYPELGDPEVVKADLNHLRQYELALPESHAQEIAEEMYFFKHIVTQEVAYESIPYATRSTLHEQLAQFMEANFVDVLEQYVNLLAHHYGHTDNHAKKRKYFLKAGEAAQAKYANDAAIDYYHRALPLVSSEKELTIRLNLGDVLISTGQYKAAVENLNIALALADEQNNLEAKAKVCRWVARSYELQGEYPPALSWIERGLETLKEIDTSETAQLMLIAGLIHARQGHFDEACEQAKHALSISQSLNETTVSARSYNLLAYVAGAQSNVPQAIEYAKQSLTLYQQTNNLQGQGLAQNEISRSYIATGQWEKAESYLQQGLNLFEQIGDVYNQIVTNINLGIIVLNRGKLEKSVSANQSALQLLKHSGGTLFLEGVLHNNLAGTYVRCENIDKARYHLQISQNLFEQAQVRDFLPEMTRLFAETDLLANDLKKAETNIREALRLARELGMPEEEGNSLRVLGKIQTQSGASTLALTVKESLDPPQFEQAKQSLTESMTILNEVGNTYEVARSQLVLAELYAIQQNNDESLALLDKCQPVFESLGASLDLKNAKMLRHDMSFV